MAGTTTSQLGGLKKPRRGKTTNVKTKTQGTLKSKAGIGKPKASTSSASGGAALSWGIATEKENSRVYREEYKTIRSSDGLFVLQYKELYSIDYTTEAGTNLKFNYLPIEE